MPLSDVFYIRAAFDAGCTTVTRRAAPRRRMNSARASPQSMPRKDFNAYMWYSYNHTGGEPANTVTLTGNHPFADPKNPWNDACTPSGAGAPLGVNATCDPFFIGPQFQDFRTNIGGAQFDWHLPGFTISDIPGALVQRHIAAVLQPLPELAGHRHPPVQR